ncbi:MAG: 1,4-dihydroxy-2-naphthoate octaprenyltransferase [Bdellovibrionota bacterium]
MISIWIQAARPKTLVSSFFPALAGILLSYKLGFFNWLVAAATLSCAIGLQILTNLTNDYFDFKKGADKERLGPARVTSSGLVTPAQIKQAILLNIFICLLLGVYLVSVGGFPILFIGILSVAFAILYTAGPFPLAYKGLGDIFAFTFFGPVAAAGSFYLQSGLWADSAIAVGVLYGFLAACLLNANNLRDYDQDTLVNKKTLVVRYGERFGRSLYSACIILSLVLIPIFCILELLPNITLITLISGFMTKNILKDVWNKRGPDIIPLLLMTAKFYVVFGLLMSIGLIIDCL